MKKIAVTGNIASGKTLAESYIKEFYPFIDTDEISHRLLKKNKEKIILEFKNFDILNEGEICRKKLGKIVFENKSLRNALENILHPQIKKELEKFFKENEKVPFCFAGIPLLFEARFENMFDRIILIFADDDIRLKRLMKRDNLSEEDALLRINSQISQNEKCSKSDFIVKNETDKSEFYKSLKEILVKL